MARVGTGDAVSSVSANLDPLKANRCVKHQTVMALAGPTQISPWSQMTRWTQYLDEFDLIITIARRLDLPWAYEDPALAMVYESVDRAIESPFAAACDERVNVFDRTAVNSLIQTRRVIDQPLLVHLQKPTYRRCQNIWKATLWFVYRGDLPDQVPKLRHQLITKQSAALDRLAVCMEQLLASSDGLGVSPDTESLTSAMALRQVDWLCLAFYVSLFDHDLKQDLFGSAVIAILQ